MLIDVNDKLVNIAQICRGAPSATLRRAYVRALREWCQQTQWLRVNVQGTMLQGERQFTLGDDVYFDIVAIQGVQGSQSGSQGIQYWPIVPSDSGQWDPNMQPGQPVRYQYIPQGQFAVDPLPQQTYGVKLTLVVQPKEGAVMIPAEPLVKYSNEIESGALEYLMLIPGQAWTNPTIAQMRGREFRSGISNGKADVQRSYNVGSQRITPRPFLTGSC